MVKPAEVPEFPFSGPSDRWTMDSFMEVPKETSHVFLYPGGKHQPSLQPLRTGKSIWAEFDDIWDERAAQLSVQISLRKNTRK